MGPLHCFHVEVVDALFLDDGCILAVCQRARVLVAKARHIVLISTLHGDGSDGSACMVNMAKTNPNHEKHGRSPMYT